MVLDGSGVKNRRKFVSWPEQVWQLYERMTGKPRPAHAPMPVVAG